MFILSLLQEHFPPQAIDLRNGKQALQRLLIAHLKMENDAIEAEMIIDKPIRWIIREINIKIKHLELKLAAIFDCDI